MRIGTLVVEIRLLTFSTTGPPQERLKELDLRSRDWAAICPAERRVRDNRFERINAYRRTHLPPRLPRPLRLPAAAIVATACVLRGRCGAIIGRQEVCGSVTSSEASTWARDPHWRPFRRGDGHLGESRGWGGFDRVRRCRQMGLPPLAPPGIRYLRRRGRYGRRGDDRGGGQPHGRGRQWQHCVLRSNRL